jgi:cyclophilin family peptidyl-prolyl cis-trans isomerase
MNSTVHLRITVPIFAWLFPFFPLFGWGQVPIPDSLRSEFALAPHYQQCVMVDSFPIVASAQVHPAALREAAWIVSQMTAQRPESLKALSDAKVRMAVMAHNEYTTDVPEHAHLKPSVFWNRRARGLGATRTAPAVSCGEENLLEYPGDPYRGENLCIHEFAHALDLIAFRSLDADFQTRLTTAFESAQREGLWQGTYAITNAEEYFAEGTQAWFDNNRENDSLHNGINTRDELRAYDPRLAVILQSVYGDRPWRYSPPSARQGSDVAHLQDFDRSQAPRFAWKVEPIPDYPRVIINTVAGDIELELDAKAAPRTVTNFLHYVHTGFYSNGEFFRTVRPDNQQGADVPIEVLQGKADESREAEFPPPIPLERTRETGLSHQTGTISMARLGPDTAQHHFFICLSPQPELDFGGKRQPDGQGFAAFGRVIRGMDVIRKIHQQPTLPDQPEQLATPIKIQRAVRNDP